MTAIIEFLSSSFAQFVVYPIFMIAGFWSVFMYFWNGARVRNNLTELMLSCLAGYTAFTALFAYHYLASARGMVHAEWMYPFNNPLMLMIVYMLISAFTLISVLEYKDARYRATIHIVHLVD